MAKRKKSEDSLAVQWSQAARRLQAVSIEMVLGVALLVLLVVGGYYGWKTWGVPITQRAEYRLSVDSIEVTPPPSWIRSNVKAEAARDASLDNLSIFDKDLTIRVYRAFKMHAWVSQVNSVCKRPPGRVIVDLEYRRPVAWVEVPAGVLPSNEVGLLPVDGTGVLLPPGDFSADQAEAYLRIAVANLTPCGVPGTLWGDARVAGAAEIAALLAEHAKQLSLHRILVLADSGDQRSRHPSLYTLTTRSGMHIIWGNPPGQEASGEPSAAQKKLRLLQLAAAAGSPGSGQEIDLRHPDAGSPSQRTAGRASDAAY